MPYYTIDDRLPYGHGEKSVYIISGFMRLSREEAFAMMRRRQDLRFFFITKRIERLGALLPEDWGPEGKSAAPARTRRRCGEGCRCFCACPSVGAA